MTIGVAVAKKRQKAVHFHEYRVDVADPAGGMNVDVVVKLYATQNKDGRWYATDKVLFGASFDPEMPRRESAFVPAIAEKWQSEQEGLKQRAVQIETWCSMELVGWGGEERVAIQAVDQAVRTWRRDVEKHVARKCAEEAVATRPARKGAAAQERKIVEMPIEKIHRHPANRTITPASCKGLAEDLERRGLLSPIQVRVPGPAWNLPEGHYQVVFGERRLIAAKLAGWDTIGAEIVELSDEETQQRITAENGQREQLNDMQRIERLQWDMRPVSEGGGGMTQTEAAGVMGIDQSTASTLLAVGKLPAVWTDLIIAGEITASHLRPVTRFADSPQLLRLLAKDRAKAAESQWTYDLGLWRTRSGIEKRVAEVVMDGTRALTKEDLFDGEYNVPFFAAKSLDVQQLAALECLEVLEGKRKRTLQRCLNVKAWRELDDAARSEERKKAGKFKAAKANSKQAPTPAEIRKQETEQDRALNERIKRPGGIAELGLRLAMVGLLKPGSEWTEITYGVLARAARETQFSCHLDLNEWHYLAQRLVRMDRLGTNKSPGQIRGYKSQEAIGRYTLDTYRRSPDWVSEQQAERCYAAGLILWPAAERIEALGRLAKRGELPDRLPVMPSDLLAACAQGLGARLSQTWEAAAKAGQAQLWLEKFVDAHSTSRQRLALCQQLNLAVSVHDKLQAMKDVLLESHRQRPLKLPTCLRDWQKGGKHASL